jgi:hypothetical protein
MKPLVMVGENIPSINESRLGFHRSAGHLNYFLDVFGDHIAQREGYRGLSGMESIHFYLIHKFGWLPRDVKGTSKNKRFPVLLRI